MMHSLLFSFNAKILLFEIQIACRSLLFCEKNCLVGHVRMEKKDRSEMELVPKFCVQVSFIGSAQEEAKNEGKTLAP